MKLKFLSKSLEYIGAEPIAVQVILGNDEGAYYPIKFPKDYLEKFNEIGKRLAKVDDITEEAKKNLEKVSEQVKLSASSRLAFLKIIPLLYEKGILTDEELFKTGIFDEGLEDTDETINE